MGRLPLAVRAYPRRSPLTFAYVCLLLLTHVWVESVLPADNSAVLLHHVSTNLDNLTDHPLSALFGSALFFDGTLTDLGSSSFVSTFITLGIGVAACLAWLEYRLGTARAFGAFLAGHIGATLLTALVITAALGQGWYPESVRQASDFGVSYGAQAVMGAATALLPRRARLPWAAFVLGWPLGGADWSGPLPDFTTVGHLLAAGIGFALAPLAAGRARPRPRPRPRVGTDRPAGHSADASRP
ncbi:rhomboid-like protein [Kitasatospora sp. NPDC090091]|uniref:rhomboid-like protein n=1 Tax=Kitasatospora sp. NPDC090091 TaxID=3364081 RepID=UPI00381E38C7